MFVLRFNRNEGKLNPPLLKRGERRSGDGDLYRICYNRAKGVYNNSYYYLNNDVISF